jgi:hypothetical protein
MTITTDTPTETKIPAWIDLDQIISPELRAETRAEVEKMTAFLVECRDRAARYHAVLDEARFAFEDARVVDVDPDLSGIYDVIRRETGLEDLVEMGWLVGNMFSPYPDSTPSDDYIAEVAERHGLLKMMASAITGVGAGEVQS